MSTANGASISLVRCVCVELIFPGLRSQRLYPDGVEFAQNESVSWGCLAARLADCAMRCGPWAFLRPGPCPSCNVVATCRLVFARFC